VGFCASLPIRSSSAIFAAAYRRGTNALPALEVARIFTGYVCSKRSPATRPLSLTEPDTSEPPLMRATMNVSPPARIGSSRAGVTCERPAGSSISGSRRTTPYAAPSTSSAADATFWPGTYGTTTPPPPRARAWSDVMSASAPSATATTAASPPGIALLTAVSMCDARVGPTVGVPSPR
jgi:hypothetical protein